MILDFGFLNWGDQEAALDVPDDAGGGKHQRMEDDGELQVFRAVPDGTAGRDDNEIQPRAVGNHGHGAEPVLRGGELGQQGAAGSHFRGTLGGEEPGRPRAVMG